MVNAAGVASGQIAELLGLPGFRIHPCLGEYAEVVGPKAASVRSMIYGVAPPKHPGIGAHLTRGVDGRLLVGPTATYVESPELPAEPITTLATFAHEASELVPGIDEADLRRAPSGIRAKLQPPGSAEAFGDFVVRPGPGSDRTFHAIGVESPGLTACFGIGAAVASWYASSPG